MNKASYFFFIFFLFSAILTLLFGKFFRIDDKFSTCVIKNEEKSIFAIWPCNTGQQCRKSTLIEVSRPPKRFSVWKLRLAESRRVEANSGELSRVESFWDVLELAGSEGYLLCCDIMLPC